MQSQPKIFLIGLVLEIVLVILTTGCLPIVPVTSPYLQEVVPIQQKPAFWHLSPVGDKLLYNTMPNQDQAIVRLLATGQEIVTVGCPLFRWLDNERIFCYELGPRQNIVPSIILDNVSADVASFPKKPIEIVTAAQVDLDRLLAQAQAIYRLQSSTEPNLLLVDTGQSDQTEQFYWVSEIADLDPVLEHYAYPIISLSYTFAEPSKKVYSPNGNYYHLLQDNQLGIYDAETDQLLIEFKPPSDYEPYFRIGGHFPNDSGGWAADSSGIYFQIAHSAGLAIAAPPPPLRPIQKLCIPGASGCPGTN
jgi:hypothetical protein